MACLITQPALIMKQCLGLIPTRQAGRWKYRMLTIYPIISVFKPILPEYRQFFSGTTGTIRAAGRIATHGQKDITCPHGRKH
jgi:hypothetical protein